MVFFTVKAPSKGVVRSGTGYLPGGPVEAALAHCEKGL